MRGQKSFSEKLGATFNFIRSLIFWLLSILGCQGLSQRAPFYLSISLYQVQGKCELHPTAVLISRDTNSKSQREEHQEEKQFPPISSDTKQAMPSHQKEHWPYTSEPEAWTENPAAAKGEFPRASHIMAQLLGVRKETHVHKVCLRLHITI